MTVIISSNSWALGGVVLNRFIKSYVGVRRFNVIMAILLVASIIPTIIP